MEAKLQVYNHYESVLKSGNILIHHAFEEDETYKICAKSAQQKLLFLHNIRDAIKNTLQSVDLQKVANGMISKDKIREFAYHVKLKDGINDVGTIDNAAYKCHSIFTVIQIRCSLVKAVLKTISEQIVFQICHQIEKNIETQLDDTPFIALTTIVDNFYANTKIHISDWQSDILNIIPTLFWPLNVNSKDWRSCVADEIHETLTGKKCLETMLEDLQEMCENTKFDLCILDVIINDWMKKIHLHDQEKGT